MKVVIKYLLCFITVLQVFVVVSCGLAFVLPSRLEGQLQQRYASRYNPATTKVPRDDDLHQVFLRHDKENSILSSYSSQGRRKSSCLFVSSDSSSKENDVQCKEKSALDNEVIEQKTINQKPSLDAIREEQNQYCKNMTNHILDDLVTYSTTQNEKQSERMICCLAAAALMPVFYNDAEASLDAEKALKRCLRLYEKANKERNHDVIMTNEMKNRKQQIRKRLAGLILGTSVMRLRHWYILTTTGRIQDIEWSSPPWQGYVPVKIDQSNRANGTGGKGDHGRVLEPIHGVTVVSNEEATQEISPDESKKKDCTSSPISELRPLFYQRFQTVYNLVILHTEYLQTKKNGKSSEASVRWPSNPVDFISNFYSLPRFIAQVFVNQYGFHGAKQLASISNEPGPVTLRRNAIRCPSDEALCNRLLLDDAARSVALPTLLKNELKDPSDVTSMINKSIVPPSGCIRLIDGDPTSRKKSIWSMEAWKDGWFEVQDAGSQLIVEATEIKMGEVVIDYCAGNGGKTLGLASKMCEGTNTVEQSPTVLEAKSRIIAHDVVKERLRHIEGSLERAGLGAGGNKDFVVETTHDADEGLRACMADVVLVDAPCSSLGVLRRRPMQRWLLTESVIDSYFPALQIEILRKAARFVKKDGGRLVYATCSIYRNENENVVNEFEATPGFQDEWERWDFPSVGETTDVVSVGASHCRTLLPHIHDSDGFFMARWKRR